MKPTRQPVVLLTGAPGCGKTTLIQRLLPLLPGEAGGFYTREIREGGTRKGFEILTLDGMSGILAHVDFPKRYRIGKYGVDLEVLECLGVTAIRSAAAQGKLIVIDEIGPMETTSERFCQTVLEVIHSNIPLLATIVKRRTPFTDHVKKLPNVRLIEVTHRNRDELVTKVYEMIMGERRLPKL